jgi:hypothetical protein
VSLVLYSLMLFYPGGGPAAGAMSLVQMHGSNQAPLLFTDAAGTIPAANPLTASGMGVIQFYAAPGHYMAELAGNLFYVPIDPSYTAPVWEDLWVHTQSVASAVWTVEHHFGTEPEVDVIVSAAELVAEVSHPDNETTVITFGAPTVGVANLRR